MLECNVTEHLKRAMNNSNKIVDTAEAVYEKAQSVMRWAEYAAAAAAEVNPNPEVIIDKVSVLRRKARELDELAAKVRMYAEGIGKEIDDV